MSTRDRNPLRLLLDVFSSVWTGVSLLSILFVYSTVGSAGLWTPRTGHFHLRWAVQAINTGIQYLLENCRFKFTMQ